MKILIWMKIHDKWNIHKNNRAEFSLYMYRLRKHSIVVNRLSGIKGKVEALVPFVLQGYTQHLNPGILDTGNPISRNIHEEKRNRSVARLTGLTTFDQSVFVFRDETSSCFRVINTSLQQYSNIYHVRHLCPHCTCYVKHFEISSAL